MAIYVYSIEEAIKVAQLTIEQVTAEVETKAKAELQHLALQVHGLILEKAQKLKSTRQLYIESLTVTEEGDNIWVVGLKKEAGFIENGTPQGELFDQILNNGKPAKISKKGYKYKIIPFKHTKPKSSMTADQIRIANYAKAELKRQGLDKPILVDGKPKIGKVATIKKLPGHDQPVGKFNQPLLAGMVVYQKVGPKGGVSKDIITYRTISDSQRGSGLWYSKGYKGLHAFEEVEKEIESIWNKIVENLINEIKVKG